MGDGHRWERREWEEESRSFWSTEEDEDGSEEIESSSMSAMSRRKGSEREMEAAALGWRWRRRRLLPGGRVRGKEEGEKVGEKQQAMADVILDEATGSS